MSNNIAIHDVDDHCELISAHHVPGEILSALFEYLFNDVKGLHNLKRSLNYKY